MKQKDIKVIYERIQPKSLRDKKDVQQRVDDAYNVLFEETLKHMSKHKKHQQGD